MKPLLLFIISSFVLSFPFKSFSQSAASTAISENLYANPLDGMNQRYIRLLDNNASNDLKAQILFENWESSTIYFNDEKALQLDSTNVNIKTNEILVVNDGILKLLKIELVSLVQFDNLRGFVNEEFYYKDGSSDEGVFEVLSDTGDVKLLKKYYIDEVRVADNPMLVNTVYTVKYLRKSKLYYSQKGKVSEMPKKKADLLKVFGKYKSKVKDFATDEKISNKKEVDLIRLFNHYNFLISNG